MAALIALLLAAAPVLSACATRSPSQPGVSTLQHIEVEGSTRIRSNHYRR